MSTQSQNVDLNTLFENLMDLNEVSKQVSNEMENKNRIIRTNIKDNQRFRKIIDNQRNRRNKNNN